MLPPLLVQMISALPSTIMLHGVVSHSPEKLLLLFQGNDVGSYSFVHLYLSNCVQLAALAHASHCQHCYAQWNEAPWPAAQGSLTWNALSCYSVSTWHWHHISSEHASSPLPWAKASPSHPNLGSTAFLAHHFDDWELPLSFVILLSLTSHSSLILPAACCYLIGS